MTPIRYSSRCVVSALFTLLPAIANCFGQNAKTPQEQASQERLWRQQESKWFLKGRAVPSSSMKQGGASQKLAQRVDRSQAQTQSGTQGSNSSYLGTLWTPLGPAPIVSAKPGTDQDYGFVAGRANVVAVDQGDVSGNTVYVGGATGGLWRSTNAAATDATKVAWEPLIDDQPTLSVGSIAIQPGHTGLILVGTGDPNSSLDAYYGLGILRSIDAGAHWRLINAGDNGASLFHGLAFAKIAFSTDNTSLAVAAASSSSEGLAVGAESPNYAATRGLYYTPDGGLNWHLASIVDPGGSSPTSASATSVIFNSSQHKFYAALRFHGFYSSSDGINWLRLPNQPTSATFSLSTSDCPTQPAVLPNNCPLYRAEIVQVPGRNEMYVWYVDSLDTPTNEGIHVTRDGGNTWITINTSGIANCGDAEGCGTDDGSYALTITAVPNSSTATDLYAGSTNFYKCRIDPATNPTCSAANGGFMNLTHVYGCRPIGSYSHVHPEQHGVAFSQSSPSLLFIANDGGLYRSTNSFAAGITGQCGTTSFPFDNLNGTLGSMAQLASLAEDGNDANTMLAAVNAVGATGTSSGTSGANGTTWITLEDGALGTTAIDPTGWFASASGMFGIQRCTKGASCTLADWQFMVDPTQVEGDAAGFHSPFLLDPQNTSLIIAGTCRVWRGDSSGGWTSGNALSGKLDGTGGNTGCASDSTGFVRTLAAGGPSSGTGSQVIYAGTEDGRIWVTTHVASGLSSWQDVSPISGGFQDPGCGNLPCPYPISAIALDSTDATGDTAYAAVLGFGIGHIWQTTSAGASWSDISGDLPDVPANSVLVDPSSGFTYVGTDAGVFAAQPKGSSTSWSAVGPPTGLGLLPAAPVTQLLLFRPSNQPPRLRAATYGRGAWEMPLPESSVPDFTLQVTNADLTTYPNLAVQFQGLLTSLNGYAKAVSLSCYAGASQLPQHCGNSSSFIPAPEGTSFSVPVNDAAVADFSLRIQAHDASGLMHEQSVTFHVMDFTVGSPSPASVNLSSGGNTTVNVLGSSLGPFSERVTISCPAAPTGISCNGSSSVFAAGSAQTIPVAVTASSNVPLGNNTVALVATSADGLESKTVNLTVQIQSPVPDFTLQATSQSLPAVKPGQSAETTLTVQSQNGFSGTVALTCATSPTTRNCSTTPASVSSFPTAVAVQIDTTGANAGDVSVSITGSAAEGNAHVVSLTLPVVAFALSGVTAPQATSASNTATFSFQLVSENGYTGNVQTTCDASSLSQSQTCTLSPPSPRLNANGTTVIQGQIVVPQGQAPGDYAIKLSAADSNYSALSATQNVTLTVSGSPTFQIAVNPASTSLSAGQTTSDVIVTITPQQGFTGPVRLSCASLPSSSSCIFSPTPLSIDGATQQATLRISTTAVSTAQIRRSFPGLRFLAVLLVLPACLVQLGTCAKKKSVRRGAATALLILSLVAAMVACGGTGGASSGPPVQPTLGTPSGIFTVVVSGTSGNIIQSANFTLTVK